MISFPSFSKKYFCLFTSIPLLYCYYSGITVLFSLLLYCYYSIRNIGIEGTHTEGTPGRCTISHKKSTSAHSKLYKHTRRDEKKPKASLKRRTRIPETAPGQLPDLANPTQNPLRYNVNPNKYHPPFGFPVVCIDNCIDNLEDLSLYRTSFTDGC